MDALLIDQPPMQSSPKLFPGKRLSQTRATGATILRFVGFLVPFPVMGYDGITPSAANFPRLRIQGP
jgi:hypothetical protein